jgi:hypothetical protein
VANGERRIPSGRKLYGAMERPVACGGQISSKQYALGFGAGTLQRHEALSIDWSLLLFFHSPPLGGWTQINFQL